MSAWFQGSIRTLLDRPPIFADLHGHKHSAVQDFMVLSTQRLQIINTYKKEFGPIAGVFDSMMHNLGRDDTAFV
jgi:hypothetical protein